ncbi:mobilization protein [Acinetobacter baumannii]|uniref:MobQ family relaxase n=1 Tax=Acinetobacter baumannii TaxID=470 RepID=UPI00097D78C0|nr:MobQ family relaxase [Acinetobacter baumannii]KAA8946798.1 mobilization protein [Acinetobacter baumannii]KAA8946809.1 mobilization protein [Acinetobacter baumannii]MCG6615586.1 mobilization protein [Acinetobacter baumannii]
MAIYHCTTKTVNRSSGRTAVASMAYRAGEKLTDERTGLTHDFTRKEGVVYTEILSNLDTELDRSKVWNLAEKSENRKDARTAREWVIALPDELDEEQRKELAREFAQSLVDRYGVVADLAIHAPSKGGDDKNHHAHILLTTRKAELDTENKLVLTQKSEIELSNTKRKSLGMGTSQEEIKQIRATWAKLANHALEYAGYRERIDHRSYADQGNQLQATIHEGSKVTQMRRKGIDTEISRFNDTIKQQNSQRLQYKQQHKEQTLEQGFNRVEKGFEQWKKDQEAKRLELEHKKQLTLQQEQAMKLKQRKSMNRNGPSL